MSSATAASTILPRGDFGSEPEVISEAVPDELPANDIHDPQEAAAAQETTGPPRLSDLKADKEARALAAEAAAAATYRVETLGDIEYDLLNCPECGRDFCNHARPGERQAWREHFTAKHGDGWYDRHEALILRGRELLQVNRPEEDPAQAIYRDLAAEMPARPTDPLFQEAWKGLTHELLRRKIKTLNDEPLPERLQRLNEVDTDPPSPIVSPFLNDEDATAIFGDGGSAKSTLVAAIAAVAGSNTRLTAIQRATDERPVILLPYEGRKGLVRRVIGFANGADTDLIRVVPERLMLGTIWTDADRIAEYIKAEYSDHGGPVGLLVVDSVGYAIGSEGAASDIGAVQFGAALGRIGLPALCVAHQTKAGDDSKPFGSAYWHNTFRMTWHIARDHQTGILTLRCRKNNEGEMFGETRTLIVEYDDHGNPRDIRAVEGTRDTVAERTYTLLLTSGSMTTAEIAAITGDDPETIATTARRHPELFLRDGRRLTAVLGRAR